MVWETYFLKREISIVWRVRSRRIGFCEMDICVSTDGVVIDERKWSRGMTV